MTTFERNLNAVTNHGFPFFVPFSSPTDVSHDCWAFGFFQAFLSSLSLSGTKTPWNPSVTVPLARKAILATSEKSAASSRMSWTWFMAEGLRSVKSSMPSSSAGSWSDASPKMADNSLCSAHGVGLPEILQHFRVEQRGEKTKTVPSCLVGG